MSRVLRSMLIILAVVFCTHSLFAQESSTLVVRGDVLNPGQWFTSTTIFKFSPKFSVEGK